MGYLAEDEITKYTKIPGITIDDANTASELIDAFRDQSFQEKTYTEQSKLTKKRQGGYTVYRGKLRHMPRGTIFEITSEIPSPFGGTQKVEYDISCLSFDDDEFIYFTFVPAVSLSNAPLGTMPPTMIKVKYSAGYPKNSIPEALKNACGMICDNAKQSGGFRSFKSRQDFDMSIAFSDKEDPILSSNVIRLINSVKLA